MAVKIRLKRVGRKKVPAYRVVVAEGSKPRDGRFIEEVGYYRPAADDVRIDEDRVRHWLAQGAQPSGTVRALIRKLGITGDQPAEAADEDHGEEVETPPS